jgi:hypothetical protein
MLVPVLASPIPHPRTAELNLHTLFGLCVLPFAALSTSTPELIQELLDVENIEMPHCG